MDILFRIPFSSIINVYSPTVVIQSGPFVGGNIFEKVSVASLPVVIMVSGRQSMQAK